MRSDEAPAEERPATARAACGVAGERTDGPCGEVPTRSRLQTRRLDTVLPACHSRFGHGSSEPHLPDRPDDQPGRVRQGGRGPRLRVPVVPRALPHPHEPPLAMARRRRRCPTSTAGRSTRSSRWPRRGGDRADKLGTGICLSPSVTRSRWPRRSPARPAVGRPVPVRHRFGWNQEEMEHHGVDPASDGRWCRESVLAMKALWTQEEASVRRRPRADRPAGLAEAGAVTAPAGIMGGAAGPKTVRRLAEPATDGCRSTGVRACSSVWMTFVVVAEAAGRHPDSIELGVFGCPLDAEVIDSYRALRLQAELSRHPERRGRPRPARALCWRTAHRAVRDRG